MMHPKVITIILPPNATKMHHPVSPYCRHVNIYFALPWWYFKKTDMYTLKTLVQVAIAQILNVDFHSLRTARSDY